MRKRYQGLILVGALLCSFGLGYFVAYNYRQYDNLSQKPVSASKDFTVHEDTKVTLERIYTRCRHVVTSDFKGRKYLKGRSLEEIRKLYTFKEGYLVWFNEDGSLVIHQRVDDWCPEDKDKRHLGVYKGYVAVYKGPTGYNEEIVRITRIRVETLPAKMRQDIMSGNLEFKDDTTLNDALESLDEYE